MAVFLLPFSLVEVTGDSEIDCDSRSEESNLRASMDEDDAESCCSGRFHVKSAVTTEDEDDDDGGVEERREVRIKSWLHEQEPNSCVSADSVANEFMNEMEKSKLFWETCLAS